MKTLTAVALITMTIAATGCTTAQWDILIDAAQKQAESVPEVQSKEAPAAPAPEFPGSPEIQDSGIFKPEAPSTGWREDVQQVDTPGGSVKWYTLDLTKPTRRNDNARRNAQGKLEHGNEWIHLRGHLSNGDRLLIMNMFGNRPPSRIYSRFDGHTKEENNLFPTPLMGEHKWELKREGGYLCLYLDGERRWRRETQHELAYVVMDGYSKRGSTGKWRQ